MAYLVQTGVQSTGYRGTVGLEPLRPDQVALPSGDRAILPGIYSSYANQSFGKSPAGSSSPYGGVGGSGYSAINPGQGGWGGVFAYAPQGGAPGQLWNQPGWDVQQGGYGAGLSVNTKVASKNVTYNPAFQSKTGFVNRNAMQTYGDYTEASATGAGTWDGPYLRNRPSNLPYPYDQQNHPTLAAGYNSGALSAGDYFRGALIENTVLDSDQLGNNGFNYKTPPTVRFSFSGGRGSITGTGVGFQL